MIVGLLVCPDGRLAVEYKRFIVEDLHPLLTGLRPDLD
jgi:hypothetical protein